MTRNYMEDPEWIYDWWHPHPKGYELLDDVNWTQWDAAMVVKVTQMHGQNAQSTNAASSTS